MVRPAHKSRVVGQDEDVDEYFQGGRESICPQIRGVTKEDQLVLKRVVGMLEYYLALEYLQPVWDDATVDERKIMDDIVSSAQEFAYFRDVQALADAVQKRHSTIWVLALARLEFNAIVAGFSHAERPFAWSTDNAESRNAYHDLLLESLQLLVRDGLADPDLLAEQSRKKRPDVTLLSTMKRLSMIHALAEETLDNDDLRKRMSAPLAWKLGREHERVNEIRSRIRSNMLRFIQTTSNKLSVLDRELVVRTVTLR